MTEVSISRRRANIGLFATFLIFALAAYGRTGTFPSPLLPGYPGSAMFPRLVLVTMGVICVFGLVRAFLPGSGVARPDVRIPLTALTLVIGALLVFSALLQWAGMEVAVLAGIAVPLWVRTRRIVLCALVGIVSVAVVYVVFVQGLSVHLPLLFLPRYLGF